MRWLGLLQQPTPAADVDPRPAAAHRTDSTRANQFLGQVETGYRLGIYAPALATLTPFGRSQASGVTQNAFTEAGAQSLNLNVVRQITNSLRTVLGADLQEPSGWATRGSSTWRCGWVGCYEFAYTGRPITAAFSGGPWAAFTVYANAPQRDSAVIECAMCRRYEASSHCCP